MEAWGAAGVARGFVRPHTSATTRPRHVIAPILDARPGMHNASARAAARRTGKGRTALLLVDSNRVRGASATLRWYRRLAAGLARFPGPEGCSLRDELAHHVGSPRATAATMGAVSQQARHPARGLGRRALGQRVRIAASTTSAPRVGCGAAQAADFNAPSPCSWDRLEARRRLRRHPPNLRLTARLWNQAASRWGSGRRLACRRGGRRSGEAMPREIAPGAWLRPFAVTGRGNEVLTPYWRRTPAIYDSRCPSTSSAWSPPGQALVRREREVPVRLSARVVSLLGGWVGEESRLGDVSPAGRRVTPLFAIVPSGAAAGGKFRWHVRGAAKETSEPSPLDVPRLSVTAR